MSDMTTLKDFFGAEAGINLSCPLCGAALDWDWMHRTNALLHIRWHEKHGDILTWREMTDTVDP